MEQMVPCSLEEVLGAYLHQVLLDHTPKVLPYTMLHCIV